MEKRWQAEAQYGEYCHEELESGRRSLKEISFETGDKQGEGKHLQRVATQQVQETEEAQLHRRQVHRPRDPPDEICEAGRVEKSDRVVIRMPIESKYRIYSPERK